MSPLRVVWKASPTDVSRAFLWGVSWLAVDAHKWKREGLPLIKCKCGRAGGKEDDSSGLEGPDYHSILQTPLLSGQCQMQMGRAASIQALVRFPKDALAVRVCD